LGNYGNLPTKLRKNKETGSRTTKVERRMFSPAN